MTEAAAAEQTPEQISAENAELAMNPRRAAMREIANNARKQRELESAGLPSELEPEPTPEPEPDPTPAPEPAAATPEPTPEPELITIEIDGQVQRLTKEEIAAALRTQRQAEAELEAIRQREEQLRETPPQEQTLVDRGVLRETAREMVTGILDGTEDEAVEKVTDALGKIQHWSQPQINEDAIVERAVTRATEVIPRVVSEEQEQHDRQAAIKKFAVKRKDLFEDEALKGVFNRYATQYHDENPGAEPNEVLIEAAKNVDTWLKQFTPAQTPETDLEEKLKRKERATENVSQANLRQTPPPKEKPPTRSQIIAAKAKARGQILY